MIALLKQLIVAMTALLALVQPLGAITEGSLIQNVKNNEKNYYDIYKKYQQLPATTTDGYKIRVDEYSNNKGVGYIIFLKKQDTKHYYQKSIGVGVDAELYTYDWRIIGDLPPGIASSTPL